MKTLMHDGEEFVDRESYLELIVRRDELADQLAIETSKRIAARTIINNYIRHIAKVSNTAAVADGVYGRFDKIHMGLGPGLMIETLKEVRDRLNRAHMRIHERADAGVALDWEDDDYGISD